jgi:hypothetical protein
MTQKNQNFEMWTGETKRLIVKVTDDETGLALNLTGALAIEWKVKRGESDSTTLLTKSLTDSGVLITNAVEGEFTVKLDPDATQNFSKGLYYHLSKVTDSIGRTSVVMTGTITLNKS